jgi:hypothetical protein
MNILIITGIVIAILLLLTALAYIAREIDDAAERRRRAVLSDHDHEMLGGSPL